MAIKGLKEFTANLALRVKEISNKKNMQLYANFVIRMIQKRTRNGYGVKKTGENATRLAPLRPATIDYRTRYRSDLHSETSPGKSNLTFSGRMLDSIRLKSISRNKIVIGPSGNARKGGLTNEKLAAILERRGKNRKARPFLNLSRSEITKLNKTFELTLDKVFKNI
jgi:hypothetical protein